MITQTYYVSTGAKNAMYTLRCRRDCDTQPALYAFMPDFYLCNLAATEEKAAEKAREYVERMRVRIGEHDGFRIEFSDEPDRIAMKRRGKLSAADTRCILQIEAGVFPFGKHRGERIEDAPSSYVLFFADKTRDPEANAVTQALAAVCMGIALDRGYVAARDVKRAEQAEIDALSNYVGAIGERRMFEGEVFVSFEKPATDYAPGGYWINKVRCGNDIVTYIGGKSLGEKGATITFKATVKKHDAYNGVKSTQVARPA